MVELVVGQHYRFKCSNEQLVYLGYNWSGNGNWHQFALVEEPEVVWAEIPKGDLFLITRYE